MDRLRVPQIPEGALDGETFQGGRADGPVTADEHPDLFAFVQQPADEIGTEVPTGSGHQDHETPLENVWSRGPQASCGT
ncbi:hypothetical protein GCM10010393_51020 [Streptomyces gobitricini]|uniref:Uncharacterized protein n=1 Tax=Streptomyces gobitricini TaxID=68211 RepID=A0ABN3N0H1_9ACTN